MIRRSSLLRTASQPGLRHDRRHRPRAAGRSGDRRSRLPRQEPEPGTRLHRLPQPRQSADHVLRTGQHCRLPRRLAPRRTLPQSMGGSGSPPGPGRRHRRYPLAPAALPTHDGAAQRPGGELRSRHRQQNAGCSAPDHRHRLAAGPAGHGQLYEGRRCAQHQRRAAGSRDGPRPDLRRNQRPHHRQQ